MALFTHTHTHRYTLTLTDVFTCYGGRTLNQTHFWVTAATGGSYFNPLPKLEAGLGREAAATKEKRERHHHPGTWKQSALTLRRPRCKCHAPFAASSCQGRSRGGDSLGSGGLHRLGTCLPGRKKINIAPGRLED